jgi:mannose-6-phosphate isomerase-like protein (cupin superfamily)
MMRRWLLLGVVAGFTSVGGALSGQTVTWQPPDATGSGQTPVMPVHQEPHHRQVFQRGPMRILDLQVPPGDISWFHTHEWPVYYLTTSDSPTVSQTLGEEWGAGRRGGGGRGAGRGVAGQGTAGQGTAAGRGDSSGRAAATPPPAGAAPAPGTTPPAGRGRPRLMSDISYAERPNTHRIRNDGTNLFRAMVVVNETAGGDEAVTEQQAGFAEKPISSNKWFRVYRIALAPGEKTSSHQHKAPVVILQDTSGKGLGIGGMTFEFNEPGQWAYFDAGDRHEVSNTGEGRLELIEVEVRRK